MPIGQDKVLGELIRFEAIQQTAKDCATFEVNLPDMNRIVF